MKQISIGRSKQNDIKIDDSSISRNHAILFIDDDKFSIQDNGSTNGTYINGQRIQGRSILKRNDILKLGNSVIPWREYITQKSQPNPPYIAAAPAYNPPTKSDKKNQSLTIFIVVGLIVFLGVLFLFIYKRNSNSNIILGNWQCTENCRYDLKQLIFEEDKSYKWKVLDENISDDLKINKTITGKWSIDDDRKQILMFPDNSRELIKFEFEFKVKNKRLLLREIIDNGVSDNSQIIFEKNY